MAFRDLVDEILYVIGIIVPAIFAVLFLYIIWKIIDAWILNAGDAKKIEEGKQLVVVAVLVFAVMISSWGIVAMIRASIF